MSMPQGFELVDAALVVTQELPNGAADVTSDPVDTGNSENGTFQALTELTLSVPALTTGELDDDDTMTYDVIHSVNSNLSSPATITAGIITQTGASGAGAEADSIVFRLPKDVRRYVAIKATNSGAGDCSAKSLTLTPKF